MAPCVSVDALQYWLQRVRNQYSSSPKGKGEEKAEHAERHISGAEDFLDYRDGQSVMYSTECHSCSTIESVDGVTHLVFAVSPLPGGRVPWPDEPFHDRLIIRASCKIHKRLLQARQGRVEPVLYFCLPLISWQRSLNATPSAGPCKQCLGAERVDYVSYTGRVVEHRIEGPDKSCVGVGVRGKDTKGCCFDTDCLWPRQVCASS